MKAAVLHGAHDIRVENVPDPKVEPDGIVVKIKASGICGSDLHPYRHGGAAGLIFGHECSGDVVEVGSNVTNVTEGDRIIAFPFNVCHQCYWCKQEQYLLCSNLQFPGWHIPGAYAEYISIPFLPNNGPELILPKNLSYETGATIEPLSVAVYGVTKAQIQPEDRVVVIGGGMIGLCIIQVLRAMGVTQIIASGRRAKRLELMKQCGADIVVDAAKEDVVAVVKETWPEKLADVVFETAGVQDAFQQAIEMVHPSGKVVLEGIFMQSFKWNPTAVITKDVTLIGSLGEDFPGAIDLLQTGKADTKPMISHEFPLDQAKEAFDVAMESDDAVKVILKP